LSDDGFERIHYESKIPMAESMELFHLVVMHGLIFLQRKCGTKLDASMFCCWQIVQNYFVNGWLACDLQYNNV